jgi:hypothetical protein
MYMRYVLNSIAHKIKIEVIVVDNLRHRIIL